MSKKNKTKPLKQRAVRRCYYDDDLCEGKVLSVHTFHKYLCERCLKETNSIKDDVLDHDFSIGDR